MLASSRAGAPPAGPDCSARRQAERPPYNPRAHPSAFRCQQVPTFRCPEESQRATPLPALKFHREQHGKVFTSLLRTPFPVIPPRCRASCRSFRELNNLKRIRVAGLPGSWAERMFIARLGSARRGCRLSGRGRALRKPPLAVVATLLAGVDARVLSDGGADRPPPVWTSCNTPSTRRRPRSTRPLRRGCARGVVGGACPPRLPRGATSALRRAARRPAACRGHPARTPARGARTSGKSRRALCNRRGQRRPGRERLRRGPGGAVSSAAWPTTCTTPACPTPGTPGTNSSVSTSAR